MKTTFQTFNYLNIKRNYMIKTNFLNRKDIKTKDIYLHLHYTLESIEMKLITINSVFINYPFITPEMGWTTSDIELFYESHLILGEQKKDNLYIDTVTFEMLIDYHRNLNKKEN